MTPTTVQDAASIDPFDLEFLEDPHPFHAMLRDAAPVVRLEKYGVYAMARYAEVHAALVDWQSFQSAAGVGLSNFRTEKPWRPPSVLLEADPPRHDAPRAVVAPLLTTRRLRDLEEQWRADAAHPGRPSCSQRGTEFDAVTDLAEVFPLRVFPDAVGIGTEGRENLLPYGDFAFNAFGPANELVTSASPHMPPVTEWIGRQTLRENLTDDGFGAQIWAAADRGEITPEQAPMIVRSLLTAGRRHDRDRNRRDHARPRAHTRLGRPPAARPASHAHRFRRGGAARPRRCRRSSAPRPATSASATSRSATARRS